MLHERCLQSLEYKIGLIRDEDRKNYCFDAVHVPLHPSDWRNVPPPLRPDKRPVVIIVRPLPCAIPLTTPLGLTVPRAVWPMILPLVMTIALLLEPWQVTPTPVTIHAPS